MLQKWDFSITVNATRVLQYSQSNLDFGQTFGVNGTTNSTYFKGNRRHPNIQSCIISFGGGVFGCALGPHPYLPAVRPNPSPEGEGSKKNYWSLPFFSFTSS